jgi:dihydroxy-acid dehydratase
LIGLVETGDIISISAEDNSITLKVSEEEITKRKGNWVQPALKHNKGILFKYARSVATASEGCVTDKY